MSDIMEILHKRFEDNSHRHPNIKWEDVEMRLLKDKGKLESLTKMEETGGEPDVIAVETAGEFLFFDCSKETPAGRRKTTYDLEGEEKRNKKKVYPEGNALSMAEEMGIEILDEEQYRLLQSIEDVDLKTSSWLKTPEKIRKLGGAIFGDRRFDHVFTYHNGADSFYGARGFRGCLKV